MKFKAESDKVKLLGRSLMIDGIRYLGYSCSGIAFEFTGKRAEAVLVTDTADELRAVQKRNGLVPEENEDILDEAKAWVAVFINDEKEPIKRFRLDKQEADYVLYESKEEKTVKLTLVKLTEAKWAKVGIKEIIIDSESKPQPLPDKKRKLEFIGDSITCGYGIESRYAEEPFATSTENGWKAYAAQVARALDADYNLVSWSGIGVSSSYTEEDKINDAWLISNLYADIDAGLETALGHDEKDFQKWDFKSFKPDDIIINLGTNDMSYTRGIEEREKHFGRKYYDFLVKVRAYNPDARILCTLGIMGEELYPQVEAQVTKYKEETGDKKVWLLPLKEQNGALDGMGAQWHPSQKTQDKLAKQILKKLQEVSLFKDIF